MATLTGWDETRFYDPISDGDAIRFNGYSGSGTYWITQSATHPGKSRRQQRDRVLTLLQEAIARGDPPGKVEDDGRDWDAIELSRDQGVF